MKRPPIFQATRVGFAAVTLTALLGATALGASPAMAAEPVGGPLLTGSGVIVDPGPNASALPDVGASTWVLADLNSRSSHD